MPTVHIKFETQNFMKHDVIYCVTLNLGLCMTLDIILMST